MVHKTVDKQIWIILLALPIVTATACNLNFQQGPLPRPPSSAVAVNLAHYTNTQYGYAFDYPKGLSLKGDERSNWVVLDGQIVINVFPVPTSEPRGDVSMVVESTQDTMIGSLPAKRVSGYQGSVGGGIPQRFEAVEITHNGMIYQIAAYELKDNEVLPLERELQPVPAQVIQLRDQVLATFNFTQ